MLKNPSVNVTIHIPLMQVWVTDGVLQETWDSWSFGKTVTFHQAYMETFEHVTLLLLVIHNTLQVYKVVRLADRYP